MTKSWTLEVQQHEDGEYFIEFPDEVLQEVDWKEGDVIDWSDNGNGSWTLKKLDKNQENTESKE
jgi:bifunctional DNA-binding transcriptional regulator/antitoxin component of YhaV-PrlF toxin-antitoxin module